MQCRGLLRGRLRALRPAGLAQEARQPHGQGDAAKQPPSGGFEQAGRGPGGTEIVGGDVAEQKRHGGTERKHEKIDGAGGAAFDRVGLTSLIA